MMNKLFSSYLCTLMKNKKTTAHMALLAANIIFGMNAPISRVLMPGILSPYTLTFFRLAGGLLLFWSASLFVKTEKVPAKDLVQLFFASLFSLSLNQLPFFVGLSMTSPIDASIVVTMLPIVTMVLAAVFIREPVTVLKAVGVVVGASGALLLVFNNGHLNHHGESNFWGNIIVFSAVASFAIYLTAFKKLISRYSPVTVMKWMFLFGALTSLPFCFRSLLQTDFAALGAGTYWRIGYIVFFATFVGYLLIPIGQKVLRPTTLSMYNYVQPIMASIVTVFIGLDTFGYKQALAGVLVFSGVYIVTQSKSRAQMEGRE